MVGIVLLYTVSLTFADENTVSGGRAQTGPQYRSDECPRSAECRLRLATAPGANFRSFAERRCVAVAPSWIEYTDVMPSVRQPTPSTTTYIVVSIK